MIMTSKCHSRNIVTISIMTKMFIQIVMLLTTNEPPQGKPCDIFFTFTFCLNRKTAQVASPHAIVRTIFSGL